MRGDPGDVGLITCVSNLYGLPGPYSLARWPARHWLLTLWSGLHSLQSPGMNADQISKNVILIISVLKVLQKLPDVLVQKFRFF